MRSRLSRGCPGERRSRRPSLLTALNLFTPTLRSVRCVWETDSSPVFGVQESVEATFGPLLNSESIPDPFFQRAPQWARGDFERNKYRLDRRRDALKHTLEFGGRFVDEARQNSDFEAMDVLFQGLGFLKGGCSCFRAIEPGW